MGHGMATQGNALCPYVPDFILGHELDTFAVPGPRRFFTEHAGNNKDSSRRFVTEEYRQCGRQKIPVPVIECERNFPLETLVVAALEQVDYGT
jgi:hypothetical protein